MKKLKPSDKKALLRQTDRLTRPPRLEGAAKNAATNPTRKKKGPAHKGKEKK